MIDTLASQPPDNVNRWTSDVLQCEASHRPCIDTAMPYDVSVRTVAETTIFQRYASEVWSDAERVEFINWIAANPEAGDLIRGSGGCRKVRWTSAGQGKRGGARVIYFNPSTEIIWLLIVYKKAKFDNLPTSFLVDLKQGVEDAL
ncbi:MAG: transcriptional regulator [Leptothrix sp. (in: b-proteobacteria)]